MERDTTYPQIHHHLERNQGLCQQREVSLLHQVCLEGKLKTVCRKSCLFLSSPHSSLLIQGFFFFSLFMRIVFVQWLFLRVK